MSLGQDTTVYGYARSKVLKNAVSDNIPLYDALEKFKGIVEKSGGRSVLSEVRTGQNGSVGWVGESGATSLQDYSVADSPEYPWYYLLGSVVYSLAEKYKNMGEGRHIDLIEAKFDTLEDSMMNQFHAAMLSLGTGDGGLQMAGLPVLVSTTPTTGIVGGVDRSDSDNAWFRNQALDTSTGSPAFGAASSTTVKTLMRKMINSTMRGGSPIDFFLAGEDYWEAAGTAFEGVQTIENNAGTGKLGFANGIQYMGKPIIYGGGINYSGSAQVTDDRLYGITCKAGGVQLAFHKKARFDMLEPENSHDQAVISRLMFTMATMTIGGLAKFNYVAFDS